MGSKKDDKGLAIIYDAHSLQQFLWYYFTYGKRLRWDALCLPSGYKGTYMDEYCKRAGVFNKICSGNKDYLAMNIADKLYLFLQMVLYWIVGKKIIFAKKIFDSYVDDIDEYDEITSICETGFVSGLSTLFAKTKKVSFFDDGYGEYVARSNWSNHYKISSFTYWQSLLVNKMGYGCKGRFYFRPTKYCYKYSAVTSEMKYHNYKCMLDMSTDETDMIGYEETLKKVYPEINNICFDDVDVVFFTDPLEGFSKKYQTYYDKCTKFICDNYKSVILKKHPRDCANYSFEEGTNVIEIDNAVPAEVLLPYLKGKKILFAKFSSIILFMQQYNFECGVFFSKEFYLENRKQIGIDFKLQSKDELTEYCERFAKGKYKIIDID